MQHGHGPSLQGGMFGCSLAAGVDAVLSGVFEPLQETTARLAMTTAVATNLPLLMRLLYTIDKKIAIALFSPQDVDDRAVFVE